MPETAFCSGHGEMAGSNWFAHWDKKANGALGIVAFFVPFMALLWAPRSSFNSFGKWGTPELGPVLPDHFPLGSP